MDNIPTVTDKVLERIESITPRPRHYFVLRNAMLWLLAAFMVLVGALAISSILFRAVNVGMVFAPGAAPIGLMVRLIPALSVVLVVAVGVLAYRDIRATRRGYTYALSMMVVSTLVAIILLGSAFFVVGVGARLDRLAARHVPFHTPLEQLQQEGWLRPDRGVLVGVVAQAPTVGTFGLRDPRGVLWQVTLAPTVREGSSSLVVEGMRVGVRGYVTDVAKHTFYACEVRSLVIGERRSVLSSRRGTRLAERIDTQPRSTECEDVRPRE